VSRTLTPGSQVSHLSLDALKHFAIHPIDDVPSTTTVTHALLTGAAPTGSGGSSGASDVSPGSGSCGLGAGAAALTTATAASSAAPLAAAPVPPLSAAAVSSLSALQAAAFKDTRPQQPPGSTEGHCMSVGSSANAVPTKALAALTAAAFSGAEGDARNTDSPPAPVFVPAPLKTLPVATGGVRQDFDSPSMARCVAAQAAAFHLLACLFALMCAAVRLRRTLSGARLPGPKRTAPQPGVEGEEKT
jgi:hypothetical protein